MITETATPLPTVSTTMRLIKLALRLYFMLAVVILLPLLSARLVMTPLFLQFEYHRADFPEDFYGFTLEDRLYYAPFALDYLLTDADIDYLGDLTFPNSSRTLFNASELHHMVDVKIVTQWAFLILAVGGIGSLALIAGLWRNSDLRDSIRLGIFSGAILTISLIIAIVIAAVVAWDTFFTLFHTLLFESGTWQFLYSDTLIRLFPEKFWFDASLTIGILTTLFALILLTITGRYGNIRLWLKLIFRRPIP
ncbi:MAG: TIGR01906 family membrane protein [Phototrophicales bacterium]|nr:TIGR01906 family membrane protein [Phototrophicales bacterium]